MLGCPGFNLARHTVKAFGEHRAQRPARAVTREHVKVMNVNVGIAVRGTDFRRVDVVEPVVGDDLAGHVENEAAQAVALVGVGVDAPVKLIEVLVDGTFHIDPAFFGVTALGALFAVNDVGPECGEVP